MLQRSTNPLPGRRGPARRPEPLYHARVALHGCVYRTPRAITQRRVCVQQHGAHLQPFSHALRRGDARTPHLRRLVLALRRSPLQRLRLLRLADPEAHRSPSLPRTRCRYRGYAEAGSARPRGVRACGAGLGRKRLELHLGLRAAPAALWRALGDSELRRGERLRFCVYVGRRPLLRIDRAF